MPFFGASSVSKMNIRIPSPHCPVDRHCLWNRPRLPKHSGHHPDLEHQSRPHAAPRVHARQHAHGNPSPSTPS